MPVVLIHTGHRDEHGDARLHTIRVNVEDNMHRGYATPDAPVPPADIRQITRQWEEVRRMRRKGIVAMFVLRTTDNRTAVIDPDHVLSIEDEQPKEFP